MEQKDAETATEPIALWLFLIYPAFPLLLPGLRRGQLKLLSNIDAVGVGDHVPVQVIDLAPAGPAAQLPGGDAPQGVAGLNRIGAGAAGLLLGGLLLGGLLRLCRSFRTVL